MPRSKKEAQSFEKNIEELEGIVGALEEGGLPLDESLKRFEKGIALSRQCEQALTEAEKKIEILTKNTAGEIETKPYGGDTAEEAAKAAPAAPVSEDHEDPPEPPEEEGELLF